VAALAALGIGAWLYERQQAVQSQEGLIDYKDGLYSFGIRRPVEWSKVADDSQVIAFGTGKLGDPGWCGIQIFTQRDGKTALTGLTDGFNQYLAELKSRYPEFEIAGNKIMQVHGATVMFYAFSAKSCRGKGIFLFNNDARIVLECACAAEKYSVYASEFSTLLQSFQFLNFETQQFIEYPLPDDGMQQLALANPDELAREVQDHVKNGQKDLADYQVKPDNLYNSAQEFRKAIQLAKASARGLSAQTDAAKGLAQATKLLNDAIDRERFEINRALRDGDVEQARQEANNLLLMMPDKLDPVYDEAQKILKNQIPAEN
jgi:hypothetical protein